MSEPRKSRARDIAVVAAYELQEALRSRRVLILVLLFVGGAVAGTLGFIDLLESLEVALAQALAVPDPTKPGAVTAELMRSPQFHRMLGRLINDRALAYELASLPPLALFYGWLGLTLTPVLIMLSSAEAISSVLATGAARFSLLRNSRLSFCLGKLLGQSLLLLGAVAVWITGFLQLASFDAGPTALWLVLLSGRIGIFAFAHVGLAVGLSHLTRSIPLSRVLSITALLVFGALFALGNYNRFVREHAPGTADTLLALLPRTHMLDLWRPEFADRLPSIAVLIALGIVYFAGGYAYRARRDT